MHCSLFVNQKSLCLIFARASFGFIELIHFPHWLHEGVILFCWSCDSQPGLHVNGAPQMMQPPQMGGGVPGPMPGQGPMGPAGELCFSCITLLLFCVFVFIAIAVYICLISLQVGCSLRLGFLQEALCPWIEDQVFTIDSVFWLYVLGLKLWPFIIHIDFHNTIIAYFVLYLEVG